MAVFCIVMAVFWFIIGTSRIVQLYHHSEKTVFPGAGAASYACAVGFLILAKLYTL